VVVKNKILNHLQKFNRYSNGRNTLKTLLQYVSKCTSYNVVLTQTQRSSKRPSLENLLNRYAELGKMLKETVLLTQLLLYLAHTNTPQAGYSITATSKRTVEDKDNR
jgi:hypothetical protein